MRISLFGRTVGPVRRQARLVVVVGGAVMTAIALHGALPGAAADPFVAGQRAVEQATMPAAAEAAALHRAERSSADLGLPTPARRSAARLADRFDQRVVDEVTEYDGRGRPSAIEQFDERGALLSVVRLGWQPGAGPGLTDHGQALGQARKVAVAVGLPADGAAQVRPAPNGSGFIVAWDRAVDGIPVPGDGLRVVLWPDGSLHNLSRSERTLAPRPAMLLGRAAAHSAIDDRLDAWFPGAPRRQVDVTSLELAWVAPNDMFVPDRPDAPSPILRLAWVGRATTRGALSASLRGLEIYLDAGDGSLLGGDILR
jgi:hypothetical protein